MGKGLRSLIPTEQKEAEVLGDCKRYLLLMQRWGRLHFVRINVGPVVVGTGRFKKYIPNESMVGCPDIFIWLPGGTHLSIEVKRTKGGVLSPGQKDFSERLVKLGHHYHVVTSVRALEEILATFNCRL